MAKHAPNKAPAATTGARPVSDLHTQFEWTDPDTDEEQHSPRSGDAPHTRVRNLAYADHPDAIILRRLRRLGIFWPRR